MQRLLIYTAAGSLTMLAGGVAMLFGEYALLRRYCWFR